MKKKTVIRKIVVLVAWLLVGSSMIMLLAAAGRNQETQACKKVMVTVRGDGEKMFIEKTDVLQQLNAAAGGSLINRPIVKISLAHLEKALEKHSWIRDAKLYFDSRNILHVSVTERQPIARVFTTAGTSFYVDSAGRRLPLLDKASVRVLVVTNFTPTKKFTSADSAQLTAVKTMAKYITAHPFWSAQIAQIDVAPSGTFELVPVIGNHVIRVGTAEHLNEKLDRLFVFYKQVASKTGFDKYPVLDVQYAGQVIGSKVRYASAIDSIQLQKNIQALIEKSRQAATQDSLAEIAEFNAQVRRDSTIKNLLKTLDEEQKLEKETLNPKALITPDSEKKTILKSNIQQKPPLLKPVKKGVLSKPVEKVKPKAVMKKREQSNTN